MKTAIASLSIAARATLNMHSLNNEGGEGNQIQTRMVEIVGPDGRLHSVNAISGDMLKHVLMEHFYQQAREQHLSLCQSCQRFNVNRINADETFMKSASKKDGEFIDQVLRTCAIDDVAGFLVTEGRSTPRKSISEFGWVLGMPERVRTDSYFHVKYASERGTDKRAEDAEGQKSGANLGQSIFHRPASSGVYALVCHLELSRIGYNDISQEYAIGDDERQQRASLLLESLLYAFIELNGAMRSTQLPHLVSLEGVITTSRSAAPAPLISPLMGGADDNSTYKEQLQGIADALNGSGEPMVTFDAFNTISDFATKMRALIDSSSPFALTLRR
ncbi:MAG TPA: DevR family CRISPR-associated autoregulator [Ktedonobacteraceae bacterium]|nr:DevR family CRISPR-associated autoregulator [Ktedonobacteraceae bacterium]